MLWAEEEATGEVLRASHFGTMLITQCNSRAGYEVGLAGKGGMRRKQRPRHEGA